MATTAIADPAGLQNGTDPEARPLQNVHQPLEALSPDQYGPQRKVLLELQDGTSVIGYSFGAERNAAGECVFSTG